jgi:GTP-binding protein
MLGGAIVFSRPYCSPVFVDKAIITIRAGKGGNGAVSFRREKFEPKGGPNGGNGGDGGNVVFVTEPGLTTLYDFRFQKLWAAQNGDDGGRKQCSGLGGQDLIIKVPAGTLIFNRDTGELMHDMKPDETVVLAKGGRGGWATSTSSAPPTRRPATPSPANPARSSTAASSSSSSPTSASSASPTPARARSSRR